LEKIKLPGTPKKLIKEEGQNSPNEVEITGSPTKGDNPIKREKKTYQWNVAGSNPWKAEKGDEGGTSWAYGAQMGQNFEVRQEKKNFTQKKGG